MQRILNFLDIPIPETQVWETLENEQRTVVSEVLARLIAKATSANLANQKLRGDHD